MPYRIAHLSDLHIRKPLENMSDFKELERIKDEINRLDVLKNFPPPVRPIPTGSLILAKSPTGIPISIPVPKEYSYAAFMAKYEKNLKKWKEEIAKQLGVSTEDLESKLDELERNKQVRDFERKSVEKRIENETWKLLGVSMTQWFEREYKHSFPEDLFKPLLRSLDEWKVDHVVVTGDITNFSRESEYQKFLTEFSKFITDDRISVIPGNHDTPFLSYSISFLDKLKSLIPDKYPSFLHLQKSRHFPYVRELGENVCLIGLNSTIDSHLGSLQEFWRNVRGRFDEDQFSELRKILDSPGMQGKVIIVAIHHHLLDVPEYLRQQEDLDFKSQIFYQFTDPRMPGADGLLRLLRNYGVRMILNGHIHFRHHVLKTKEWPEILTANSLAEQIDGIYEYNLLSVENGVVSVAGIELEVT